MVWVVLSNPLTEQKYAGNRISEALKLKFSGHLSEPPSVKSWIRPRILAPPSQKKKKKRKKKKEMTVEPFEPDMIWCMRHVENTQINKLQFP